MLFIRALREICQKECINTDIMQTLTVLLQNIKLQSLFTMNLPVMCAWHWKEKNKSKVGTEKLKKI